MSKIRDYITLGDGYADVALKRGVEFDGVQLTAVRMREPTVADDLAAERQGNGAAIAVEMALFANLCGQPVEFLHKLKSVDYRRLQEAYRLFLD